MSLATGPGPIGDSYCGGGDGQRLRPYDDVARRVHRGPKRRHELGLSARWRHAQRGRGRGHRQDWGGAGRPPRLRGRPAGAATREAGAVRRTLEFDASTLRASLTTLDVSASGQVVNLRLRVNKAVA